METKKNSKIFHPFLIAFFPIMAIYSVNIGLIQLEQFIFPTILIVLFMSKIHFKEWKKSSAYRNACLHNIFLVWSYL
jgi:hypothetical protein